MPDYKPNVRYVNYPIEPDLFDGLGLDPATAGVPEVRRRLQGMAAIRRAARPLDEDDPDRIAAALSRYRAAIDHARTKLGGSFGRREMCLIADVMNGTWLIGDWADHFGVMVVANLQDSVWPEDHDGVRHHGGYADKWFGAGKGEARTKALVAKLREAPPIVVDAIAQAVRDFWRDPAADVDSDWWLPHGSARRGRRPSVAVGG